MTYLLGIDIGTSACKVGIFHQNGEIVAEESYPYLLYHPKPEHVEQNPEEWWSAVISCITKIFEKEKIKAKDIAAIGVDGQSWSCILLDKQGNSLENNPIWMDRRAIKVCKEWEKTIGRDAIFKLCGNPLSPSYTTPKIKWFQENKEDVYKKCNKVLQSNSYIVYKLTGKITQELSQAYGLHCFDMQKGTWDTTMAKEMGIDLSLLPEIYKSHEVAGVINKEASEATGLLQGTPVVCGGLDAACGALGAGVIHEGEAQEQGGQAGGMSICLSEYCAHPKLILSPHVVDGYWLLQGGTVGGGCLKWLKEQIMDNSNFEQMNDFANTIPACSDGLIFLPYMEGERSPIWNEKAKGVFFGLDYSKTKSHLIRAVMEGVGYSLLHNIKTAEEAGLKLSVLNAIGGAASSLVWTQIKSDITGKEIQVPSTNTATTLGAALLAGIGVGVYEDFDEAVTKTVHMTRTHIPNLENHAKYRQFGYPLYSKLYEQLKELML